jgi:hypothetical protein
MADWIFVVRPKNYPRIESEWASSQQDIAWVIKQHHAHLANAIGDGVYIYMTGVGIVARGEITGPKRPAADTSGWDPAQRAEVAALDEVPLRVNRWLPRSRAIPMAELRDQLLDKHDDFFGKNGQGTNFLLEPTEATDILAAFNAR